MYVINEFSKNPIFNINQHIGLDKDRVNEDGSIEAGEGQGIDGVIFANEVLSLNDKDIECITFYINCMGGDVKQSLDIFNAIAQSKHKTYALISGFSYSCGGWIPLAADKVEMVDSTGSWMCHMPYNPDNPNEKSEFMDAVVNQVSKVIAEKSGRSGKEKKTQDQIKKLMKVKTYWDAKTMEREGLIDKPVDSKGKKIISIPKELFSDIASNNNSFIPYYKEYQTALNKEITTLTINNKNNSMKFIIERLNAVNKEKAGINFNLTNDAPEAVIVESISRMENFLRAKNDEMMDMKNDSEKIVKEKRLEQESSAKNMSEMENKIKDMEKSLSENKAAFDKMKVENDAMCMENKSMKEKQEAENKSKAEADLTFRKERAKNYVDKIVLPKSDIPEDQARKFWEEKAINNYEEVVMTLGSIQSKQTVFKAPKIGAANKEEKSLSIIEHISAENFEGLSASMLNSFTSKIKNNQYKTVVDDNKVPLYKQRLSDGKRFDLNEEIK